MRGAFVKHHLAGSIMGVICQELYGTYDSILVVENMSVDESVRKTDIGRALFAEMECRAKMKGCSQVILVTETNRLDACAFYESIGFHPTANKGYKKKL